MRPDIAAYSSDKKLVLIIEIKKKHDSSPEWAMQMRHNLLAQSVIPISQYFLLALPDVSYLWMNALETQDIMPDYEIETEPILAPYFDKASVSLDEISEQGLELLVTSWIRNVAHSVLTKETTPPALHWMFDSGLYEAIRDGSVQLEAAA